PLLAGLALAACGRRTTGAALVIIAAAVGGAGLALAQLTPRSGHPPAAGSASPSQNVISTQAA
ncbi:MAG: hypothetical protein ACRDNS_07560, partial [Trebonia sp.]